MGCMERPELLTIGGNDENSNIQVGLATSLLKSQMKDHPSLLNHGRKKIQNKATVLNATVQKPHIMCKRHTIRTADFSVETIKDQRTETMEFNI